MVSKSPKYGLTAFQKNQLRIIVFLSIAVLPLSVTAATRTNGIDPIIQLFTGGMSNEGVMSGAIHINGAPVGPASQPSGITRPSDLILITPEIDYSLTSSLEATAYLPMVANTQGGYNVAGGIGRLTWMPYDVPDEGGFFAGTTWAFSGYQRQFSFSSYSLNGGFTSGYEDDEWLFAVNGFVNWNLSGSQSASTPSFSPAVGVKRYIGDHLGLGFEYYGDIGSIARPDRANQQYQAMFGVVDWDEDQWSLNFGVGRCMTQSTDEWMVKMIVFVNFEEPETNETTKSKGSFSLDSVKSAPSPIGQPTGASPGVVSNVKDSKASAASTQTGKPEEDDDDDD